MKFNKILITCLLSISNLMWWQTIIAIAAEDELNIPTDLDSTPSSSSNNNNDDVSSSNKTNMIWPINLILTNSNILLTYLFDLNSMKNNLKFIYNYIMARFLEILLPIKEAAIQLLEIIGENNLLNHLKYYLHWIQNLLFRFDTIIVLLIFFVLSFFMHRRNVINIHHQRQQQPTHPAHNHLHHPYSLDRLLTKVFRCLNFTVVFSNLFTVVDSTIKSYFETQTVINQAHYGTAGAYSIQGRRPNMEDCFSLKNNISQELGIDYYAVFDGHGGPNAALFAEKEIFESISKRIKNVIGEKVQESPSCLKTETLSKKSTIDSCPTTKSSSSNKIKFESLTLATMKNIINEEIINVDKRLVETFTKKADISGTTAIIAIRLIHSNKLLIANVGDSRAILCDSKGATIPMSFDHKPYQLKEYRRILEAGGYISLKGVYRVNGILAISRALGDYPLKNNRLIIPDPDILTFDLNEFHPKFMIMASDGFWDTFSNENAVQYVQNELSKIYQTQMDKNESLSSIALLVAKRLAKEAYTRESYDNITVIFILFDENKNSSISTKTNIKSIIASAAVATATGNSSSQTSQPNKYSSMTNETR